MSDYLVDSNHLKGCNNNSQVQQDRQVLEVPVSGSGSGSALQLQSKSPLEEKIYRFSLKKRMLDDDAIKTVEVQISQVDAAHPVEVD